MLFLVISPRSGMKDPLENATTSLVSRLATSWAQKTHIIRHEKTKQPWRWPWYCHCSASPSSPDTNDRPETLRYINVTICGDLSAIRVAAPLIILRSVSSSPESLRHHQTSVSSTEDHYWPPTKPKAIPYHPIHHALSPWYLFHHLWAPSPPYFITRHRKSSCVIHRPCPTPKSSLGSPLLAPTKPKAIAYRYIIVPSSPWCLFHHLWAPSPPYFITSHPRSRRVVDVDKCGHIREQDAQCPHHIGHCHDPNAR